VATPRKRTGKFSVNVSEPFMTSPWCWFRKLRLGLGVGIASLLTLIATAPAVAGFVRIEGTGFSLYLGDRPVPYYHYPPSYKYFYPHYYHPIKPVVPHYYPIQPITPSITITPQGTSIILPLPFTVIQRSHQQFYYYGF
jgi:hypothetical protein